MSTTPIARVLPSDGVRYFVLYLLDHWDLTEHGGSVGGSWLSEKGRDVLAVLRLEAEDGFQRLCASCCIHGYPWDESTEEGECPECAKLNQGDHA